MKKYVAFDPMNREWDFFDSIADAQKWLIDDCDWSEGMPDELADGEYFIAEIILRSSFVETDRRENYPCLKNPDQHAVCSGCDTTEEECERTEEWPYDNDFEYVGRAVMVEPEGKA